MKKFVIAVTLALAIFGLSGCSCVKTILCKTKNCETKASCTSAGSKGATNGVKEKTKQHKNKDMKKSSDHKEVDVKKPATVKKPVVKEESSHLHAADK
ncbi:hypothetical protein CLAVI_000656 [Candidatus Clavichlamydia salmonicola]|uniref:hypothetical protein n=1 Tax=Candidatus Clavichlamydia salmonicola TaxID=469812 RepID=UPI0018918AD3|nr:hypothetical protein [Candidatus Clavichlamydia salmonicola]MBF5051029.1 hypothetical protein [Candidatus Clavichlamydia salmonicola]